MLHTNVLDSSSISLILNYAPLGLVRALRAEYGTEKILVDTGCVSLANDSEVDIMICIDGTKPAYHFIRARVSGSHPDGAILSFQNCNAETTRALLPYITIH